MSLIKLMNLRKRLRETLKRSNVSQDILDLINEIEKETDKTLDETKPTR